MASLCTNVARYVISLPFYAASPNTRNFISYCNICMTLSSRSLTCCQFWSRPSAVGGGKQRWLRINIPAKRSSLSRNLPAHRRWRFERKHRIDRLIESDSCLWLCRCGVHADEQQVRQTKTFAVSVCGRGVDEMIVGQHGCPGRVLPWQPADAMPLLHIFPPTPSARLFALGGLLFSFRS